MKRHRGYEWPAMAKSVEKQQTDLSAKSQSRSASHSSAQMSSPDSASDKTPYNEKTQRIMAWSNLLRSLQPWLQSFLLWVSSLRHSVIKTERALGKKLISTFFSNASNHTIRILNFRNVLNELVLVRNNAIELREFRKNQQKYWVFNTRF